MLNETPQPPIETLQDVRNERVESLPQPSPTEAAQAYLRDELDPTIVKADEHPYEPLVLLNYTDKCQKSRAWDEVTMACRGLIIDRETGEIHARPFMKFFNIGETEETAPENLPRDERFLVTEKIDGRLMVMYRDSTETPFLASRGSFSSDESRVGTEMLHALPNLDQLPAGKTLMFEAVYPDGHVVIDYGETEELVLLSGFDIETGEEMSWDETVHLADTLEIRTPQTYEFASVDDLLAQKGTLPANLEGFVIKFEGGMRVKLKGDAYLELHKAAAGIGPNAVYRALAEGNYAEWATDVPEELEDYVERLATGFREDATSMQSEVASIMEQAPDTDDMKIYAQWVNSTVPKHLSGVVFALKRGKEINWIEEAQKAKKKSS